MLKGNLGRMGVRNAVVLNESPERVAAALPAFFDRVLVDAPCSGEGMFRKEEAAVTDWSQEVVEMCARRQAEILHSAAQLVRPGGRLVYSTCTFAPEEDEGQAAAFVAMRIGQLSGMALIKIEEELAQILEKVADLEYILQRPERLRSILKGEILDIR